MTKQNLRKLTLLMSMSSLVLTQAEGALVETAAANPAGYYGAATHAEVGVHQGFDIDKIKTYLEKIDRYTRGFESKDVVAVFGGTRVGKGTIINALLGIEYDIGADSNLEPIGEQSPPVPTCSKTLSHTLFPAIYGEIYMDLPGFLDNRDAEEKICSSIAIELALQRAKSVKLVGVIDSNSLFSAAPELKELGDAFSQILRFTQESEERPNVLFLFNKVDPRKKAQHIKVRINTLIDEYQSALSSKEGNLARFVGLLRGDDKKRADEIQGLESKLHLLNFMKSVPERLVIVDPLNSATFQEVKEAISTIQPVSMKTLTLSNAPERVELRNVMYSLVNKLKLILQPYLPALESHNLLDKTTDFCANAINYYQAIIGVADNDEFIAQYRQTTDDQSLENEIRAKQIRLKKQHADLDQKITKYSEELREYDSSEEIEYWEDSVIQTRTRWMLWMYSTGWTEKLFSYKDVPFLKAEESHKDGTFEEITKDLTTGQYEAKYQSRRNYDGIASVKIYIEKRNKPDIALKIAELKQLISEGLTQIALIEHQEQELALQLSEARITSTKEKLVRVQERLQAIVNTLNERKLAHKAFVESYEAQKDYIDSIHRFLNEFRVALGDSSIFAEFQKVYADVKDVQQSDERALDPDLTCPISQEPLLDAVKTPCGHMFNRLALVEWLAGHNGTCPNCRGRVDVKNLTDDHETINETLDALKL